jgi:transcriptional regulator with GAF, ATPase, and Fis domain
MLKVSCISNENGAGAGEIDGRVVWIAAEDSERELPRRLVAALLEHRVKLVTVTIRIASQFPFRPEDLVVFEGETQADAGFPQLVRTTARTCSVFIRSSAMANHEDVAWKTCGAQFLDENEGFEVTKARILKALKDQKALTDREALADRRESRPEQATVPEWRRTLVGQSRGIQKVAEVIRLVGPRRCTVLITGETGTGKEIAARAIHNAGPRADAPFVALNCSAVPASLMEAELFGHTRGAFTGAAQARIGRIEQAEAGTLFLDEIGDLSLELQAKLLRVLQEREYQRLGSSETLKMNARVLAATNCDLRMKVACGEFRADLYYRLNVVPLELPPLRARVSDLEALTQHFLKKVCEEERLETKRLSPIAWAMLEAYSWPGNVRQLENVVCAAVILSGTRAVLDEDDFRMLADVYGPSLSMGPDRQFSGSPTELPEHGLDFAETVNALERDLLSKALKRTGGNKKAAADILRMKRTTLSARVRVLDIGQKLLSA